MFARLGLENEEDAIVEMAKIQIPETQPYHTVVEERVRETYRRYITTAEPTFFVADDRGEVVGYLMAYLHGYAFTDGVFVNQEVLYVRPDKRGTRAAATLVKEFIRWGDSLGAKELFFGVSNKFQPERTARFFEHFGAERVGYSLKLLGAMYGRR